MRIIQRPDSNEKYVLFKTTDQTSGEASVIGYYRVGHAYYQESKVFNNNGFVWGFSASEPHLIKLGEVPFRVARPGRGYKKTWDTDSRWPPILRDIMRKVRAKPNYAVLYQGETNRLVSLLKDQRQVDEWRQHCDSCNNRLICSVYRYYSRVERENGCDMYSAINRIYRGSIYSRNLLCKSSKIMIRGGD
jgi:hypothetical protein